MSATQTHRNDWSQAKPHEFLLVRKCDLQEFLGRITVAGDNVLEPAMSMPDVSAIQRLVAASFMMDRAHLLSKSRESWVVWPRHVAIHLAQRFTGYPLTRLALDFGQGHGTILYALQHVRERIDTEPQIKSQIEKLASRIQGTLLPPGRALASSDRVATYPAARPRSLS